MPRDPHISSALPGALLLIALATAAIAYAPPPAPPARSSAAAASGSVALLAAGDIARCGSTGDDVTAALLDSLPGEVLMLGDAAYPSGTLAEFRDCYDASWGRHRLRTLPVPGNHEYRTEGAQGYYDYFGLRAHPQTGGAYAVTLGAWRVIALNSSARMGPASRQFRWLARELRDSAHACTLVFWHHPRFSSGEHGNQSRSRFVWWLLHRHGVELVLNAHDHDYERFAPQSEWGRPDPSGGVRQFVVGTGGASLRGFGMPAANSEVRDSTSLGVLALDLAPGTYRWRFVAAATHAIRDSGGGRCN